MTNQTLGTNTQDETRAEDGASSGQSLTQALDRLATQLDDTTHHGMGLVVRLMIESRERDARERQSDGYPRTEEMRRLRLPLEGPEAEHAYLRFIHATASPGTSSGWLAMLEKNLLADIALVEELAEKGEGGYLAIASAGKLTIADLVSHLVHLRNRLTFWAGTLETYPPPLVDDVVELVAHAAERLRYAANLPSNLPAQRSAIAGSSGFSPGFGKPVNFDQAERLSKLPAHVLASVMVAADKSPLEVKKLVARHALEASHGNVKAALRRMKEDGYELSQATMYTYRKELLATGVDPPSQRRVSKADGIPEDLQIVRSRRKSEDHKG